MPSFLTSRWFANRKPATMLKLFIFIKQQIRHKADFGTPTYPQQRAILEVDD